MKPPRVFSYGSNINDKSHCSYEHQDELNSEEVLGISIPFEFDNRLDRFDFKYAWVFFSQVQDEFSYILSVTGSIFNPLRYFLFFLDLLIRDGNIFRTPHFHQINYEVLDRVMGTILCLTLPRPPA